MPLGSDCGMEACTLQDEVLVVVTAWARPMIVDVGWRIRVADDGSMVSWVCEMPRVIRRRRRESILGAMMKLLSNPNSEEKWERENRSVPHL